LGIRINNTNSKNRPWVNIYLLGIFWKNYQFFDLLDPFLEIIKSLEMRFMKKSCDYDFASFIVWNKLMNKET
jgi:hypothetical protein